jgi:hypothetical protein
MIRPDKYTLWGLIALVVFLFAVSRTAPASECSLSFGGWSKHFISNQHGDGTWNEEHNLAGLQCDRYSVHYFRNSHSVNSVAVGYDRPLREHQYWTVAAHFGIWSGYRDIVGDAEVIPVIMPKVTYRFGRLEVNGLLSPFVGAVYLGWRL